MDFEIISPTTKNELLEAISSHQNKNFKFGAGYTDLINQFKNQSTDGLTIINLAQLDDPEFTFISEGDGYIELGAMVTASDLVNDEMIKLDFPVLYEAASSVASIQIRNSATIGGNICNASPSADMSAALVALESLCCILDTDGNERMEKLEHFIQGVRKTSLAKNEILRSIHIPKNSSTHLKSGFEKVGTRKSMEISIISFAYHFQLDTNNDVLQAGVSCGAVAPNIPFAEKACDFLRGKNLAKLSVVEKNEFADKVLEYASPISDIRASEWYRREVLRNLAKSIFE